MGQMTVGIMYGCESPDLPVTEDSDEPLYDLIYRWEQAKRIAWTRKGPRIRQNNEGSKTLLGVWIAVGGSGKDDAGYIGDACVPFDSVRDVFAKRINKAAKLWGRFAAWAAKKEGIELPAAQLWITPCETA